jgi:cell wall-associated NlpC family hydrolase
MKKLILSFIAAGIFVSTGTAAHAQHYVAKGETLGKIAKEYHMNLADLISLNKHIKNPNLIKPGDYIVIRSEVETAADVVDYAKSLQYTTAYKYGGQNFPYETDCSGFVQGVYKKFGVTLPRVSKDQAKTGTPVKFSDLQIGDLMFFSTRADHVITHVGIYMGNDYWISNLNTDKDVQILSTWGKWAREYFQWGTRYKL